VYGSGRSATTIVLFGDSHAAQWFAAFDPVATARRWRLVSLSKAACPPVEISLWSPVLSRPFRECERWRAAALERIRAERPAIVVLGMARHYGPEYHFRVYGPAWIAGLRDMVRRLRVTGARVVVVGPTPKPDADVPDCLSQHLRNAVACTTPLAQAVNFQGVRAEHAAVVSAGGAYVDVTPWICTRSTCAAVVGNLLVYRDDNHLSAAYAAWLSPAMAVVVDQARQLPNARLGRSGPAVSAAPHHISGPPGPVR
jgi:hypothetical protein